MTFVPCDLACFIGFLETPNTRFIDIQWLLDESLFWTSEEKYLFVRKLYDIIVVMEKYWAHSKTESYIKNKLEAMKYGYSETSHVQVSDTPPIRPNMYRIRQTESYIKNKLEAM
ncbi:uncharacterized protein LOC131306495 [Rhododendron vialii]|uniref:uncharacterized protein LOC131306495 n=1 Tax=Rhododendron vialii TaxID=182163 RepID=UPI00265E9FA9|nr:uncharacterized protein LOC131306495 [Rhododendron vialii]